MFFSHAEDIQQYLERVVAVFGLRKYMHFNTSVRGSYWNDVAGTWTVKLAQRLPDGAVHEYEETCDLLLQCTGVLSRPKLPDIEGFDVFNGNVRLSRYAHALLSFC